MTLDCGSRVLISSPTVLTSRRRGEDPGAAPAPQPFGWRDQRAPRHRPKTDKQNFIGECEHCVIPLLQPELIPTGNREKSRGPNVKQMTQPTGR